MPRQEQAQPIPQPGEPLTPELAFAQVLRERRKALGLTQQDLEEDGVAQSYISKLELGKRQVCLRNFIHIAEMLETTPVELMDAVMKRLHGGT